MILMIADTEGKIWILMPTVRSLNTFITVFYTYNEYIPFEQSTDVILVDTFFGHCDKMGWQQRQCNGKQVRFTAQTVVKHATGYQAHQVDLRDQSDVSSDQNPNAVMILK